MATYSLPGNVVVRTNATRRFLIVGHYDGARPSVETTTDDENVAAKHLKRYRTDFPWTKWYLLDQSGEGGS